jgi:pimeloyl-ACP methyl ester carboxylesterase
MLPPLSRRALLATIVSGLLPAGVDAKGYRLLDPSRVANAALPEPNIRSIDGGNVSYVIAGKPDRPLILYLHGWADDYKVVLPLEYSLLDAGFRILLMHRPGYKGTSLDGNIDRRTADGAARTAAALLNELLGERQKVFVVGTSGGCPTALAFAGLYPERTRRLLLQAGVGRPWTDERYVPPRFRDAFITAYKKFGWTGDHVSEVIFGSLVARRESTQKNDQYVAGIVGSRLQEARADPAFTAALNRIMHDDKENAPGKLNDARHIFLAKSDYCPWDAVTAPTLVIHDPEDPLVPLIHAEEVAQRLKHAKLRTYRLGGHLIYVGADAMRMHRERVNFLSAGRGNGA